MWSGKLGKKIKSLWISIVINEDGAKLPSHYRENIFELKLLSKPKRCTRIRMMTDATMVKCAPPSTTINQI